MAMRLKDLKPVRRYMIGPGIEVTDIEGKFPVAGSVCRINLKRNEFRMFCFFDLINKSLCPNHGCFTETPVNLGATVRDFIQGNRHECEGLEGQRFQPPYLDDYRKVLVASNSLQTNFIRPNGFVVDRGRIVAKPPYAPGRLDPEYVKLGPAGVYWCFLVDNASGKASIERVELRRKENGPGFLAPWRPKERKHIFGFASPLLVKDNRFERFAGKPWIESHQEPHRTKAKKRRLWGNWVEWDIESTARSFTAFGVEADPKYIVMASIFEGQWGVDESTPPPGGGITPRDFARLLMSGEFGARVEHAVLGGGSGDTQQFVHGRYPRFREGPVRQKLGSGTGEVEGVRGAAAIAAVLPRR
jgi:hypothetical protein